MITTDVEELRQLCREWQERLGLLHWEIKLNISRYYNMPTNGQADVSFKLDILSAVINIVHPEDFSPERMTPQDMERSLVHELLHLLWAPLDEYSGGSLKEIILDQCCELLARALVKLKREQI